MLVLSRKEGEKIFIGDGIVLTINRIAGNRVAIGVQAPREVSVVRGELGSGPVKSRQPASGNASPMTETHVALAGCQIN